jgi:uncharacterized protein YndB with AHSA1/START domain
MDYPQRIEKRILIKAMPGTIWEYLTVPDLMTSWMGDPEMTIEIVTDWKPGSPFVITGFHHVPFENKGTILQFEQGSVFQYNFLSSLSNLEDAPNNYTGIAFYLERKEDQTELRVEAENFPTFEIYKHLEFYWNGTLKIIQWKIEHGKSENKPGNNQIQL